MPVSLQGQTINFGSGAGTVLGSTNSEPFATTGMASDPSHESPEIRPGSLFVLS